ncbi:MAG TPA: transglycosylase domain-containing protein [Vicinamibacterales bacterium]|nr:transglycosylase domain-containing protein [Vicinamibacterales bacterium]
MSLSSKGVRIRIAGLWRKRWVRVTTMAVLVLAALTWGVLGYYYVSFSRLIDRSLHGERDKVFPQVFARPLDIYRGQSLTHQQLIDRLNDLGYAQRPRLERPGEFAVNPGTVSIVARTPELRGQVVQVSFQRLADPNAPVKRGAPVRLSDHVTRLQLGPRPTERLTLDAPVLSAIVAGEREKRRPVALSAIQPSLVEAVLAIEDRRYYEHPGVDPIGVLGAITSYATGRRSYLAGGSTITQQLVRNVFLPTFEDISLQEARRRSMKRKALEAFVSIILTSRASKDDILEMYLNNVPLGQRGSFAIFGVAEASRLFFGKDVSNVSLTEAATIAGVIQQPSALSPFTNPQRCRERRNVVLFAMADAGYINKAVAERASQEPLVVVQRALEAEAPYFVDYVNQTLDNDYPGLTTTTSKAVDVYTTLDLHLQRLAQDAVRKGLTSVDSMLAKRKRGKAEAALIALDPRTGEILSFVSGRSYNQSQYNRAIISRRQPGSVFKPFVYLTAFEQAIAQGRDDVTPSTITLDEQETFEFDEQVWTPENYEKEYLGPVTYRYALAHSLNLGTIHVAQSAGYQNVAALWKKLGVGNPPKPYPSIALGVFEATPYEIATAYTLFPNGGAIRPLRNLLRVMSGGSDVTKKPKSGMRTIARPDTTFLVTDMMRAVLNEGTAAPARSLGFTLDAAGKTGTTNDKRDAWFVGFTPELLTVVWVGLDDNEPLGLTGAQAALPIWTDYMIHALAGRDSVEFPAPEGITFVDVDRATGKLPTPACPMTVRSAFIEGTVPTLTCEQR